MNRPLMFLQAAEKARQRANESRAQGRVLSEAAAVADERGDYERGARLHGAAAAAFWRASRESNKAATATHASGMVSP